MGAVTVTASDFDDVVLKSDKMVLVDFWAEWCQPCKALSPILEQIANEMNDKIVIAKLDVEADTDLAQKYQIRSLPSLLLFRDGNVIATSAGAQPKVQLQQWIESNLEPAF
ncbi:MAG: thioredoxin [Alphaproteobacteria bacterium]|nr:thioredoxin [Alphaproteobacteria bacterium]